ncbi:MAG TPA: glycosyltransferase [Capillimicrobium sp.]|nr:glycosyltransferase [Capillimicrobium sp.]
MSGRPVLFYSDWPLGYHNQEAERKARDLAAHGYDVVYVAGVGTRNPRLSSAGKAADRLWRKLRPGAAQATEAAGAPLPPGLRAAGLLVAPPRQVRAMRRLNARWVERQLRGAIGDWPSAVAWIRHATPELVDALRALRPAAVVYEVVDAHHTGPGMTGVWLEAFEAAERELATRADAVVVTNPPLAPRFEAWGIEPVLLPHGVELFDWAPREAGRPPDAPVLGFLGVLDVRLDRDVIRHVASARPRWTIRLVGPVERGFDPGDYADLPNVRVEPPVPHAQVGEVLRTFDVGLLAYADSPMYRGMAPLKLLECLAAGRPVVARPAPAMAPFAEHVAFAETPEAFVAEVERVVREDTPELAAGRRRVAEANAWEPRLAELRALVARLTGDAPRS